MTCDIERQRAENRRKNPAAAKMIDEVRKVFPDARIMAIRPLTKERHKEVLRMKHEADRRRAQEKAQERYLASGGGQGVQEATCRS